jgi:predicted GNAT family N-acyltransferase
MTFREVAHQSKDYWDTVALRTEVLRKPLNMQFSQEELLREDDSIHLGAYNANGELLACLILKPVSATQVKMRQVCVSHIAQRTGVGTALVGFSETYAKGKGFTDMLLHARQVAVGFYRKMNYYIEGEPFIEVGLPHFKMRKAIR